MRRFTEVDKCAIVVKGESFVVRVVFLEEISLVYASQFLWLNCSFTIYPRRCNKHLVVLLFLSFMYGLHIDTLALLFNRKFDGFNFLFLSIFLLWSCDLPIPGKLLGLIFLFLSLSRLQVALGLCKLIFKSNVYLITKAAFQFLQLLLLFLFLLRSVDRVTSNSAAKARLSFTIPIFAA